MRRPEASGPPLPPLREAILRYGLRAKKSLGQHFLLDLNLTARIARAAGDLAGKTVVEIGPGPGGLTRALLASAAREVIAVERDDRCIAALSELGRAYPGRLKIVAADALKADLASLAPGPVTVVSNLPYNIGTRLLLAWLERIEFFERFTLMFQKEVADRFLARPGSRTYGRSSVLVQWRCHARREFDVPPEAFTPPPKVTSTVLTLIPRERPLCEADARRLAAVTKAAFGQRRKMLRSSLKSLAPDTAPLLSAARIDPKRRAQDLTIEEFCALARAYAQAPEALTDPRAAVSRSRRAPPDGRAGGARRRGSRVRLRRSPQCRG